MAARALFPPQRIKLPKLSCRSFFVRLSPPRSRSSSIHLVKRLKLRLGSRRLHHAWFWSYNACVKRIKVFDLPLNFFVS